MNDRDAYIAFNLTDSIGPVGVAKLAARFGSVASAWEAYANKTSRTGGEVDVKGELDKARGYGVALLTRADPRYPEMLRRTAGAPLVLYVKGDVAALSKPSLAVIGTRRATSYGRDQAYQIAHGIASAGWSVVSGLAVGIDAEAHRGALAAHGTTVGILGSALDAFYPDENRELAREIVRSGGAVVSEFPFGRRPDEHTFPQRNHVVAALSRGVVAVECPIKSGTLITTGFAADLGRTVMAVPGRVDAPSSSGCLSLLRDGARMVRGARDILEEMRELAPQRNREAAKPAGGQSSGETAAAAESAVVPTPPRRTLEESMIMRELSTEGVSMEKLVAKTGLSAAKVGALAMTLRLKGLVRFLRGNRVALPRGT